MCENIWCGGNSLDLRCGAIRALGVVGFISDVLGQVGDVWSRGVLV